MALPMAPIHSSFSFSVSAYMKKVVSAVETSMAFFLPGMMTVLEDVRTTDPKSHGDTTTSPKYFSSVRVYINACMYVIVIVIVLTGLEFGRLHGHACTEIDHPVWGAIL